MVLCFLLVVHYFLNVVCCVTGVFESALAVALKAKHMELAKKLTSLCSNGFNMRGEVHFCFVFCLKHTAKN